MRGAFLLPKNYKRQVLYMPNDGLRLDAQDPEYQFIDTGTEALAAQITAEYEALTGTAVQPASPEKLLIHDGQTQMPFGISVREFSFPAIPAERKTSRQHPIPRAGIE